jgi:HlyD family secretion protein
VDSAQSSLKSAEAAVTSSKASVSQSQANFNQAQVNLEHTIITSPVDGIVTQRSVDVGQTVAASMQAPTLFVIAVDLTKLQVSANIDEADIGRIRPGSAPRSASTPTHGHLRGDRRAGPIAACCRAERDDLRHHHRRSQLRAETQAGYDGDARVEVSQKSDVLRVPSAALRFRPTADVFAALNQPVPAEALGGGRGPRRSARRWPRRAERATAAGGRRIVLRRSGGAECRRRLAQQGRRSARRRRTRGGRFGGGNFVARRDFAAVVVGFGGGGGGFGGAVAAGAADEEARAPRQRPGRAARRSADTIDALFAPLPPVESRGRVWTFTDKQLKPWTFVSASPTARSPSSWTASR